MFYYEVWVSSQNYHSDKSLTYCHDDKLSIGTLVVVLLRNKPVPAVVVKKSKKPNFTVKPIVRTISSSPLPTLSLSLISWLKAYYPSPFGQLITTFIPNNLVARSRTADSAETNILTTKNPIELPLMNITQKKSVDYIEKSSTKKALLHGDTGTGKTRVYLELTKNTTSKGKSVIILTPEIGLTPQLATSFHGYFPGKVIILHSNMSQAERRNNWLQVLESKEPIIVIGPRSALFAPINRLGLVILDEFHESSYKQEQAPHYHASRVAAKLADLYGAKLVLGSATPPVSDYFAFEQKNLPIIRMDEQAITHTHGDTNIQLIDLKDRKLFNNSPWISDALIKEMKKAHRAGLQTLVFLNRRGTARLVLCQKCGWQATCTNCDLPLTYHGDKHILQCHTCGFTQKSPLSCPSCSNNDIVFRSVGTKSITEEISRLIPQAKVARFDSDTNKADSLEKQYSAIKNGSVDILVGTQMLGKGLDLPKLSVVGIITAETSLFFPDYTAEERTFQLITQALGRVNRGHVAGTAIIQCYNTDNPILSTAAAKDYKSFYDRQITERRAFKFPPFMHVLKLTCARTTSNSAKRASEKLIEKINSLKLSIIIIGPSPAFVEKTSGKYRWQVIVKSTQRNDLTAIIEQLPANWTYDIDPLNLL